MTHPSPGTCRTARAVGLAVALSAALSGAAVAATNGGPTCNLTSGGQAEVAGVEDDQTVRLADGRTVSLIGISLPRAAANGPEQPPFVPEARDALRRLVQGRMVELRFAERENDRHGRLLAQLFVQRPGGDAIWVQAELVRAGFARVSARPEARGCTRDLLAREAEARRARLGLWADPWYAIRRAEDAADLVRRDGRLEIVEGRVMSVGADAERHYVNFGPRWSEDFTLVIPREAEALFTAAHLAPRDLAGRRLRVRGVVQVQGGPMIVASHPEQIEVLDAP